LSVEEMSDGSVYLLYKEAKLTVLTQPQDISYTHEKVLIQGASAIRFEILGWNSAIDKIQSEDPLSTNTTTAKWVKSYNSVDSNLMPISVAIIWDDTRFVIPIINDQGAWLNLLLQTDEV
jgi:hypothetical protein